MQTTQLPRTLCDDIDRRTRKILWGGSVEQRKIHNVAWVNIIKSKNRGALSLHSMRQINAAYLAKLGWRVVNEKDKLWSQVLRAKYCDKRCDLEMFTLRQDAFNAWKGIIANNKYVQQGSRLEVGNGLKTLFWHHKWALDTALTQWLLLKFLLK